MTRKGRDLYLKVINGIVKEDGVSRCVYLIRRSVLTKDVKYFVKRLHPWDYKKKYPFAAKLFTALCYDKKPKDFPWGYKVADVSKALKVFKFGEVPTLKAYQDIATTYIKYLEERPGEWVKRFRTIIKFSNLNPEVLDMIFTYLENNNFDKDQLEELRKKMSSEKLEHEDSINMMINAFLLQEGTNKKETN